MARVLKEALACYDCYLLICNGEVDPDMSAEREAEILEATAGWSSGDRKENLEFSSRPCGLCRCHLAGERFHVALLG